MKQESVNHPKHYTSHPSGVECIDVARHYCFSIGNAIKYLWRAGLKREWDMTAREKEIEDLEKAVWYINDRISELRNEKREKRNDEERKEKGEERKEIAGAVDEYYWDDGECGKVL